jgi:hypothetical protein
MEHNSTPLGKRRSSPYQGVKADGCRQPDTQREGDGLTLSTIPRLPYLALPERERALRPRFFSLAGVKGPDGGADFAVNDFQRGHGRGARGMEGGMVMAFLSTMRSSSTSLMIDAAKIGEPSDAEKKSCIRAGPICFGSIL